MDYEITERLHTRPSYCEIVQMDALLWFGIIVKFEIFIHRLDRLFMANRYSQ